MNVLITGDKGFIGAALRPYLKKQGHRCWGFDIRDDDVPSNRIHPWLREHWDMIDAVVHLGAAPGVQQSIQAPEACFQFNTQSTAFTLERARLENVKRFIFASSAAAANPISPYGASKAAGEALCRAYTKCYGMTCIPLRFANVFGPGSYEKSSVVAQMLKAVVHDQPIVIHGTGEQRRDFVHVWDVCQAIEAALTKDIVPAPQYVGSGDWISVNALAFLVRNLVASDYPYLHKDALKGDICEPPVFKIMDHYIPQFPIEQPGVLEAVYEDFKQHFSPKEHHYTI